MGSVPVLKPREVVALLERLGFVEIRQRGSHKQFRHPDGRTTTVPFYAGRDISPTLLCLSCRDSAGLENESYAGMNGFPMRHAYLPSKRFPSIRI
ncbi:MAG: type II toxin-antitoxin system HicA family toxin [Acidobacteria bacterium]|nr:type II toxin-antitoxin system HicA family toxin [Acidobacteriota bacterium]